MRPSATLLVITAFFKCDHVRGLSVPTVKTGHGHVLRSSALKPLSMSSIPSEKYDPLPSSASATSTIESGDGSLEEWTASSSYLSTLSRDRRDLTDYVVSATIPMPSPPDYSSAPSSVTRSSSQTDAMTFPRPPQGPRVPSSTSDSLLSSLLSHVLPANSNSATPIDPSLLSHFSLLLLSQFVLFLGVGAVIPTIPIYGQSIGLSSTANGVVIAAPALSLLLLSRLAGQRADLGRKPAMMGGMALIAFFDVLTSLSSDLPSLLTARLGLGLGRGFAEAGERGMLADLAGRTPELRGRASALQQAAVGLGVAIGAPVGGVVVEEFGMRSAFLCVSVAAVAALGIYAVLPETVAERNREENGNGMGEENGSTNGLLHELDSDDQTQTTDNGADWQTLLRTSPAWRSLSLCQSGTSFGYACKIAVVPILASTYLPGGAAGAGLLLSAAGLSGLLGAPLGGFLADEIGAKKAAGIMGTLSGVSLALVPLALSVSKLFGDGNVDHPLVLPSEGMAGLLSQVGGPEGFLFALLVLLWSTGASAQGPALTALGQEMAPVGAEATALGLPRAAGDGTYIIAPLALGYVSDRLGGSMPGIACTVAGVAMCLGSLVLLFLSGAEEEGVTGEEMRTVDRF